MRSALQLALLIIVPAVILSAADPFLGYWKLDPQRCIFTDGRKPLTGGVLYMATDDGYIFGQAISFGEDKVATRYGRVQFGTSERLNNRISRLTRSIDGNSYDVVYTDDLTGSPFCVFRYTVYPQIGTLIIVLLKGDEPIETLVFNRS